MLELIALALLYFSSACAGPLLPGGSTRCGTTITPERQAEVARHFSIHGVSAMATDQTNVNVHFHVISENNTLVGGNVPDSQLVDQISVLNKDFASSDVSFTLVNTTRTINADWFNLAGPKTAEQTAMKTALHAGDKLDLNVYTVGFNSGPANGLLGYSTFPWEYKNAPIDDGIVILFSTVPGGAILNYNLGRTLTHEVGHWVGLYHTFENGCSPPGDEVDDTPPEAGPAFACPVGRDTCKADNLPDPIHNYMDYTYDSCMDNFTPGQGVRLKDQVATYRT